MNLHAKLRKIKRKKRGVSPIIAAILLIGLAVLAGAAIYLVVIPMLTPTTSSSQVTATMSGTASVGTGTATFTFTTANKGLKDVNVSITGVTIGTGTPAVQVSSVQSGGSNVAAGYVVQAGQTTDVTVVITWTSSTAPSGTINVAVSIGAPVNSAKTFSLGTI